MDSASRSRSCPTSPSSAISAPGATYAPHHVPEEWAAKYKGRFDQGWDAMREEILERQKALGVVPPETQLTPRHEEIPAWEDMPDELKPVLARQMEIYAGFLEHTDHHVGRLVDTLEDLGILEDTFVYYIIGDNGASAEGTPQGSFNENIIFNGAPQLETPEFLVSRIEEFGTPAAYNHYAVGWAHAMDTPYQWTKQVASHWGGTRTARSCTGRTGTRRGRGPHPVPPRDRRGAHRARGSGHSRAELGERHPAEAHRGHQHALLIR